MPPTSAAMELKVLINILTSGTAIKGLLSDTKALNAALGQLQDKKIPGGGDEGSKRQASLKGIGTAAEDAAKGIEGLNRSMEKAMSAVRFLAGGFLALESVRFLKDLADTAARAQVLSTVLHVVGNNAGYSVDQLDKADREIQSLGITATASRQALTQFIQAELELSKAPALARAAQDAAVILGTNSSEAFSRLVTSIQTSNTLMLRHMGIIVQSDLAYQRYAQAIGKTAASLTTQERAQAFLNATLLETQRIAGSYIAAMGDVGKQLTSLDRYIENLKESLGNQLLPAYLAIVQELTIFLQHMGLVADSMNEQGDGAKKLGEDIKVIARALREGIEFVVKYREEILAFLAVWAALKLAVLPVIEGFIAVKKALTGVSAGESVLGRLIAGVGLLGTAIIALGLIVAYLQVRFDRFDAVIGSILGTLLTVAQGVESFGNVVAVTMASAIKSVTEFMYYLQNPFESEKWKEPWKNWSAYVKSEIDKVKDWWELTKARFHQALTPGGAGATPDTPRQTQLQEERAKNMEEEAQLMVQITDQTDKYNKLLGGTDKKLSDEALAELNKLKNRQRTLELERKAQQEELKYSDVMKQNEAARLKDRVAYLRDQKLIGDVEAIRGKQAFTSQDTGKQFNTQLGDFTGMLAAFRTEGNKAGIETRELGRQFTEMAQAIKTPPELVELRKQLVALRATKGIPADELVRAAGAVQNAERQVRQARLAETSQRDAEELALYHEHEKRVADIFTERLDLLKIANEAEEAEDKAKYSHGLLTMEEYHRRRLERIKQQNILEIAQAQNAVRAAEEDVRHARTPTEAAAAETRRREAVAALGKTAATGAQQEQAETNALTEEQIAQRKKIREIELQNAALYGTEAQAADLINQKYEDQVESLHVVKGSHEDTVLMQQRDNELLKSHMEYMQRDLDLTLERESAQRDALTLRQAEIDAEKARVEAAQKMGAISEVESMRLKNALVYQQIEKDTLMVESQRVELAAREADYAAKKAVIEQDMINQGKSVDSPETVARIRKELGPLDKEILNLKTNIIGLDTSIATGAANLELYSTKIKDSFTNSLADAITQTTLHFKTAGDVWKRMADSIASEIVGIFTKRLAQMMTQNLSFKIFDRLFGLGTGGGGSTLYSGVPTGPAHAAEGGLISGPGTGTSDSIPAMLSAGEHVMPADKTARWLPLLEGIRTGSIIPAYALGGVVALQSIAMPSVIPRRYAGGGVVVSDAGAASVQPGGGGVGNMVISLHPDAMNMTLREWLEQEVVRQQGRR